MEWMDSTAEERRITEMRHRIDDNECIITWNWPEGIQFVYVYGFKADAEVGPNQRAAKDMKLYTRDEYKARKGYRAQLDGIGRFAFRVYVSERVDGNMVVHRQEDEDNIIRFSSGKAKIFYSIKYGRAFFSKRKPVRIQLNSEVYISRDALCYVKKEGSFPLHADDGIVYPFIHDIQPGRNVLPEIEINKDDQLKLFFTDRKKYGEMFELIPE